MYLGIELGIENLEMLTVLLPAANGLSLALCVRSPIVLSVGFYLAGG